MDAIQTNGLAAWEPIAPGSPDRRTSTGWLAIYKYTHPSGFAVYWTFAPGQRSRKQRDAFAVGGLLAKLPAAREWARKEV
jgi:hypothetical protein